MEILIYIIKLIEDDSDNPVPSFDFEWRPPDLSEGGTWYNQRVASLRQACKRYRNSEELFADGLSRLAIHRANYDADGPNPKFLQLLWWEFPVEHHDELRDGFRMNFLKTPPLHIIPNADMDENGLEAAREFVDELIELGVF